MTREVWKHLTALSACCAAMTLLLVGEMHARADQVPVPKVTVETVLSGLDNPCGIALQPGTGHIFVSDSGGLRVVKFDPTKPGEPADVITGFPEGAYGSGLVYKIGPLGLAFLDKNTLLVGGGGLVDGEEVLRVYLLPKNGSTITADAAQTLGPLPKSDATATGAGNFYGLAVNRERNAVYITSNGDDAQGWLLKATVKKGKPVSLAPFISTKITTGINAPVAIAMNHKGFIVVGQMGEMDQPHDSLLTMYRPDTKQLVMRREVGLHDISALAYSESHQLYAADFSWNDPSQGGVFRLDEAWTDDQPSIAAVPVVALHKPTAMVFGRDGALYVTTFGSVDKDSDDKPGSLVRIEFK